VAPESFSRLFDSGNVIVTKKHLQNKECLNTIKSICEKHGEVSYISAHKTDTIDAISWVFPRNIFCDICNKSVIEASLNRGSRPILVINYNDEEGGYLEEYYRITSNSYFGTSGIAFNQMKNDGNGTKRFRAIRDLITQDIWKSSVDHWLFGLTNPVETILYKKGITSLRIRNSIKGFVSDRCYIDSALGINYQSWTMDGSVYNSIGKDYKSLTYTSDAQFANFILNDLTMKGFCDGSLGLKFWETLLVGGDLCS
jgi:hypothetical protein